MSYIIATNAWRSIGEYISILLPGFLYFYSLLVEKIERLVETQVIVCENC